MNENLTVSETLNLAADLIERGGWYQGSYSPDAEVEGVSLAGRPVCLLGALHVAADEPLVWSEDLGCWSSERSPRFAQFIASRCAVEDHLQISYIPGWNDDRDRTAAEVIEVLRATAVIEAARESELAEVSA